MTNERHTRSLYSMASRDGDLPGDSHDHVVVAALRDPALLWPVAADWLCRLLRPASSRVHEARADQRRVDTDAVGQGRLCVGGTDRGDVLYRCAGAIRPQPGLLLQGLLPDRGEFQCGVPVSYTHLKLPTSDLV